MSARLRTALLLLVCGLCCGPPTARQAAAQSVEPFKRGRRVAGWGGTARGDTTNIAAGLGGGHLPRFTAATQNITAKTTPGGGGPVPANRLYFNSDKDGAVLAKLERAVPQLAI